MTAEDVLELDDLESAEDFLRYFGVPYNAQVVQVHRLHILQRFHDYLAQNCGPEPTREEYRQWLARAHADFVASDARTEKVFEVFRRQAGIANIPLSALRRARG